jgi:ribose transport system permease protein
MEYGKLKKYDIGRIVRDQRFLLIVVIILISTVVGSISPGFFTITNIMAIMQQISVLGILTMGMSLLMISGGLDLSIGLIMALSCVVMAKILMSGGNIVEAIAANVFFATLCGFLNGVIVAKSKCIPLIITLGMQSLYFGIALVISGGNYMNFKGNFDGLEMTHLLGFIPISIIILVVVVVLTHLLLRYTKFGRRIVSIGGNEEAAYLAGIRVDFYKIITYAISGFLCSIAAIIFAARLNSIVASGGSGYELSALTAAVIGGISFEGGRGSVGGAFIGVLMMGLLSNAMNILGINSYWQEMVTGAVIVVAVVVSNLNMRRRK